MDEPAARRRLEELGALCRERGLPLTLQRRAIFRTVLDLDGHPTADRVHEAVNRRLSGISRTTIYRTLETLVRLGVIARVCHPGHAVRYDHRIEAHHHLVCRECDRVIDISGDRIEPIRVPDTSALGFEVSDTRVILRGVCRRCRESKEEPCEEPRETP